MEEILLKSPLILFKEGETQVIEINTVPALSPLREGEGIFAHAIIGQQSNEVRLCIKRLMGLVLPSKAG